MPNTMITEYKICYFYKLNANERFYSDDNFLLDKLFYKVLGFPRGNFNCSEVALLLFGTGDVMEFSIV